MPVFWLDENLSFPPPERTDRSGILAVGGDLSPARLLLAYRQGIFPWFNPEDPILWWSPDPRFVLFPEELKIARSMRPYFNKARFSISLDSNFEAVMRACSEQYRPGQGGTWITDDMIQAYCELHRMGYAHSVEVWQAGQLVAGLYGIALGRVFFGESMFSTVSNASKYGFIALVKRLHQLGFRLIDCQQETPHLTSLGARGISRGQFMELLREYAPAPDLTGNWGQVEDFKELT
jgi:leucyl/phenylalanyl-tRNA---protein transferase